MKLLNQFIKNLEESLVGQEEVSTGQKDTAVLIFARFNPPNVFHEFLISKAQEEVEKNDADLIIIPRNRINKSTDPLPLGQKVFYMKQAFEDVDDRIVSDKSIVSFSGAVNKIIELGYSRLIVISPSDKEREFTSTLENGEFELDLWDILSVDESVERTSAQMRRAAVNNDYQKFEELAPLDMSAELVHDMMQTIIEFMSTQSTAARRQHRESVSDLQAYGMKISEHSYQKNPFFEVLREIAKRGLIPIDTNGKPVEQNIVFNNPLEGSVEAELAERGDMRTYKDNKFRPIGYSMKYQWKKNYNETYSVTFEISSG